MKRKELEREIDRLYRDAPEGFVRTRNALVRKLRDQGQTDDAAAVAARSRPLVSAWVVNHLYHAPGKAFARLIVAGTAIRKIQHGRGDAARLRKANDDRRRIVESLCERARGLLVDSGLPPTPAMMRRIETTLDAISIHGGAGPEQELGRLARDIEPPGFAALLGATPKRTKAKPVAAAKTKKQAAPPKPDRTGRLREARQKLREAEREQAQLERRAANTERTVARAKDRLRRARELEAEARDRLSAAHGAVAHAADELEQAQRDSREVAGEIATARRTLAVVERQARKLLG